MDQASLLVPRIVILFLIPIELGIVAWYFLYWDLFPKYSVQRLLPWLIFLLSGVGIPLLQIFMYKSITSTAKVDDLYVGVTIFAESMLAVALAFYLLFKRRVQSKDAQYCEPSK